MRLAMDKYLQVKDLKWWKKPLEKSLRFQGTKKKQCFCQAAVAFASHATIPGTLIVSWSALQFASLLHSIFDQKRCKHRNNLQA